MTTIHEFGPFRLDAGAEMLFRESEPVALGRRAVVLLRLLVERAGSLVRGTNRLRGRQALPERRGPRNAS